MSSHISETESGKDHGPKISDPTFRTYSSAQAAVYAAQRGGYKNKLIEKVLSLHQSASGSFDVVLDVGTGTGQVIRDVAPFFTTAFGVDPGTQMIAKAREIGGTTKAGKDIEFLICAAEDLDKLSEVEHGSVNLITAGMAVSIFLAHSHSLNEWKKSRY